MNNKLTAIQEIEAGIDQLTAKLMKTDEVLLKISKDARGVAASFKGIQSPKDTETRTRAAAKATEQLNAEIRNQNSLEKALINTIARKNMATEATARAVAKQKFELNETNKRVREAAVLSSSLSTEYQKQSVKLTQLIRQRQDLALKQQLGNKLTKEEAKLLKILTREIQRKDRALKTVDAQVGRFQRNVGNYAIAMRSATAAARAMATQMGLVGGAFMVARVIMDATKRVREFDKEMQNMAGILRTDRKELKDVEQSIIEVAGKSIKTSNEVAKLASSLFTLGKTKDEVIKLLEPVNNLSIAMQTSSDEAGEFLAQMLNAFGKGADSAAEFADIIATIRTSTSLDFQKMRDSFQYIAPISAVLNKDLAYTGSVVGILADNGLKAESAGRLLATAQQRLAARGKTLNDALDEINQAYKDGKTDLEVLAQASDLFGEQAGKVGVTLAKNTDLIEENAQAIRDNSGALDDLVNEQLESLDAKLKILDSTWEEFILSIDNGKGPIGSFFGGLVDWLTKAVKGYTFLNESHEDYLGRLGKQTENNTYKELLDFYKSQGEAAEDLAIKELAATDSKIEATEAEIAALKKKEEAIRVAQRAGDFGPDANATDLSKTKKEIDELTNSLAYYKGVLKATEEFLGIDSESTDANTDSKKKNGEAMDYNVKIVQKLRREIAQHKAELQDLTKDGYEDMTTARAEQVKATRALIAEKQKELDAITGAKKGKKEEAKAVKGTIKYYEDLISAYKKQQNEAATTAEEYKELQYRIDTLNESIKALKGIEKDDISIGIKGMDLEENARETMEKLRESIVGLGMEEISKTIGESVGSLYSQYFEQYGDDFSHFSEFMEEKLKDHAARMAQIKDDILTNSANGIASALGIEADAVKEVLDGILNGFESTVDAVLSSADVIAQTVSSLASQIAENNAQRYEEAIEQNREYYDRILSNEQLSDQQREALEKERDRKEAELEKKKRQKQRQAAVLNKVISIAEVGIQTAKASIAALAPPPVGLGPLAGNALIPFILAQGAIQSAVIAATPLPAYFKGKGDFDKYEGPATWGEKKREIRFGRRGVELSPKYPGLHKTHVFSDDVIHPDADAFLRGYHDLLRANSIAESHERGDRGADVLIAGALFRRENLGAKKIVDAIERNRTKINLINNIDLSEDLNFLAKLDKV